MMKVEYFLFRHLLETDPTSWRLMKQYLQYHLGKEIDVRLLWEKYLTELNREAYKKWRRNG